MSEVELKLAVPPGALTALRSRLARYGRGRTRRVDTVYLDTADHKLASIGAAVRLRRIGARWVQTLKLAERDAALSTRGEWEAAALAKAFLWARFPREVRRTLMARLGLARLPQLEPQFRTRFVRTTWDVTFDGADIELALDVGEVVAGRDRDRRKEELCELELELKAGGAEVLPRLARRIVRPDGKAGGTAGLPLLPQPLSKAARGRRLAQAAMPAPVKADRHRVAGSVQPSWTAAQALRAIVIAGGDVLWANVHGALRHDDPGFVHQARVAIRRMRSAIRLLRKDVDLPASLAGELRWIGRVLGRVRDADVLLFETLPHRLQRGPAPADAARIERVMAAVRRRRAAARERMRSQLASARCAAAGLALMQWACARQGTGPVAATNARPMRELAPTRLDAVHRKLATAARRFRSLSTERQHRVRILAKRLRYSIDVFFAALPGAPAARFSEAVEKVQDALGAVNDVAAGARAIRELVPTGPDAAQVRSDTGRQRKLTAAADQALSELLALPVPWRVSQRL